MPLESVFTGVTMDQWDVLPKYSPELICLVTNDINSLFA